MNEQTYTLPADLGGGGYLPGFIVPATIILVALLATAGLIYFTQIRPRASADEHDENR